MGPVGRPSGHFWRGVGALALMIGALLDVAGFVGASGAGASGTILYASPTSTTTSSCTISTTPCDLTGALSTAGDTDTIELEQGSAAGHYTGHFTVGSNLTGITIEPDPGTAGTVVLDGEGTGTVLTLSSGSSSTVEDLTITDGRSTTVGGGIDDEGGTVTVTDATISTNTADTGGGVNAGASGILGSVTVDDSTLVHNTAGGVGGGIGLGATGRAIVDDSTLVDNTATAFEGEGGGIFDNGTATITDDTFSGDTAAIGGGGVANGGTTTVTASIFDGSSCFSTAGTLSGSYNVVTTTTTCTSLTTGKTTTTALIDLTTTLKTTSTYPTAPTTLAIGPASPAINEVPPSVCTSTLSLKKDERGAPRPGDRSQTFCDAGAYELQFSTPSPPPPPVTTKTTPGAPDLTTATPGTGLVHLAWTAPKTSGSSAITGYEVCYATTSAAVATCTTHKTAATATSGTVTGLINGTKYYFAVKAENTKGYGALSNTLTATPAHSSTTTRVAGATADATAAAEFQRTFPSTKGTCPVSRAAVVATTAEYNDALSSQFLAQSLTTGTLLTPTKTLSPVTAATLEDEGITTAYVVGGPLAITTTVVKAIEALTADACGAKFPSGKITVTRLYGTTQYGTAEVIAEHVGTAPSLAFPGAYSTSNASGGTGKFNDTAGKGSAAPTGAVPTAILASGVEFQDAQAASVISYHTKLPLLLTPATNLSTTAVAAIEKLGIKQVILMGGTLAISNTVETTLVAKAAVSVLRVAGKDYTETAIELARFEAAGKTTGLSWTPGHKVLVARGNGFTDGIAGAVLDSPLNTATGAKATARPLLLTETPTVVGTFLTAFLKATGAKGIDSTAGKTLTAFTVLGGPLALTTVVVTQMETDLKG